MDKDKEKLENEELEEANEVNAEDDVKTAETETEDGASESEETPEKSLTDLLEEAKQEAKANFDKYLRQLSEFENFRKRSINEKTEMYSNGVRGTIEKLLPVLDNFERALDAFEDKESAMFEGVNMIYNQLLNVLKDSGVEEIAAQGESFDPNLHNAVMHIEDESIDTNIVVEVFQKGYKLGNKVIRPSMVKVAN